MHVVYAATRSVPRPSECTKIVGGWGFAPYPTGGAYSAPPRPPSCIQGVLLLRGGEGRGKKGRKTMGGEDRE